VESAVNRDALKLKRRAQVVWLCAEPRCLIGRLAANAGERPLLQADPAHRLAEMQQRREPLYAGLAHYRVDTDDLDMDQVVERIALILAANPDGDEHEAID
jgi:shikimate kinase